MIRSLVLLLGCATVLGMDSMQAAAPVVLTLSKSFAQAGLSIVARVDVDPHPDNRRLYLVWDGPVSGESSVVLDEDSPSRHIFDRQLVRLPEGDYHVIAVLRRLTAGRIEDIRTPIRTLTMVGTF